MNGLTKACIGVANEWFDKGVHRSGKWMHVWYASVTPDMVPLWRSLACLLPPLPHFTPVANTRAQGATFPAASSRMPDQ
eukprot:365734-Chlamydomonas_euryale.AAC.20